jgi:hypothetical protein
MVASQAYLKAGTWWHFATLKISGVVSTSCTTILTQTSKYHTIIQCFFETQKYKKINTFWMLESYKLHLFARIIKFNSNQCWAILIGWPNSYSQFGSHIENWLFSFWVKTKLEIYFKVLTHVREPTRETKIDIFFSKRKRERMSFHMKTLNSIFKVLNKFGSLVPLVLLFTWGFFSP